MVIEEYKIDSTIIKFNDEYIKNDEESKDIINMVINLIIKNFRSKEIF